MKKQILLCLSVCLFIIVGCIKNESVNTSTVQVVDVSSPEKVVNVFMKLNDTKESENVLKSIVYKPAYQYMLNKDGSFNDKKVHEYLKEKITINYTIKSIEMKRNESMDIDATVILDIANEDVDLAVFLKRVSSNYFIRGSSGVDTTS